MNTLDVFKVVNEVLSTSYISGATVSFPRENTLSVKIYKKDLRKFHESFAGAVKSRLGTRVESSAMVVGRMYDDGSADVNHLFRMV